MMKKIYIDFLGLTEKLITARKKKFVQCRLYIVQKEKDFFKCNFMKPRIGMFFFSAVTQEFQRELNDDLVIK